MEKYKIIKVLGEGSFGRVVEANDRTEQDQSAHVAIKQIKKEYNNWEECINLRELRALKNLRHPNIVRLKEMVLDHKQLYFVFEFIDSNLGIVIDARKNERKGPFDQADAQRILHELLEALAHMHKHGYFHRDIKPENLLCNTDGTQLKVADFGLARETRSRPPYTEYVSTRWYRAPEVLLGDPAYSSPVDTWACGCILAELHTLQPFFQGSSSSDQLSLIFNVVGSPSNSNWPDGIRIANNRQPPLRFPHTNPKPVAECLPSDVPYDTASFIAQLLSLSPSQRPTAKQALQHSFFSLLMPQCVATPRLNPADSSSFMTVPSPSTNVDRLAAASTPDVKSSFQPNPSLAYSTQSAPACNHELSSDNLESEIESLLEGIQTTSVSSHHAKSSTSSSVSNHPKLDTSYTQATSIDELLGELDSAMASPKNERKRVEAQVVPLQRSMSPPGTPSFDHLSTPQHNSSSLSLLSATSPTKVHCEWTQDEVNSLATAVELYPVSSGLDRNTRWRKIASMVGTGRSKRECYNKYKELSEQTKAAE